MLSVEELLKPRIIVENNYPRSPFKHHEIICEPSWQQTEWAKELTLNFRFLDWWEYREEKDMPEYVNRNERIYKVYHYQHLPYVWVKELPHASIHIAVLLPATEEEYNNYHLNIMTNDI